MESVEVAGDSETHTLSRLQTDTEYILTVIPLYEGNTEGPAATARFRIGGIKSKSHQTSNVNLFSLFVKSAFRRLLLVPALSCGRKQHLPWCLCLFLKTTHVTI